MLCFEDAHSPEVRYVVSQNHDAAIEPPGRTAAHQASQSKIQGPVDPPPRSDLGGLSNYAKQKLSTFQDKLSELVYKFRKDVFHRPEKPKLKDICERYEREGKEDKVFIPNVWKRYTSIDPDSDIVVVTQMHEGKIKCSG